MTPVLEVSGLSQDFGGLRALSDLDLHVNANEIVALIGPNGAGKTTFFNCVTGIYTPTEGKMYLYDADGEKHLLNGKKPHKITAMGMARTFQNIRLFSDMTVLENVMVGRHCRTRAGIWGALSRNGRTRREEQESIDISYALLESLHLQDLWNERARNLAYGAQRRLEIARALATEPRMLLLDEPAAGMNPQETRELEILVRGIRDARNLSILLIEHDMSMVMSLSDRIYVMEYGSCIASGKPGEVRANPRVIKAYLGESDA
ncbi:ABC transporter ATP-binding protein [uncultured Desulfovibrio sp.]|uniref:ABC transporter ATP-binding protein n=1 Tax=uncultured Desulfovibrio sp. TaxID=167968 RepID=UPI0026DC0726|nr:ABC transporter ATP-binding protein [uncultured Desulfovibrio sp.]